MSTCKMIALSLGVALLLAAGCSQPTPAPAPPPAPPAKTGIPLIEGGASAYSIVIEPTASPSERQAAQDVQAYVQACTGVALPIAEGAPEGDGPMLVLGNGAIAHGLGVSPTSEQLGGQGYHIKTVAPHIVIAGTREAGTLYGAWDFLESEFGVRWYAPGVTQTPEQGEVRVAEQDRIVKPPFMWRLTSYEWPGGDAEFRNRQRENNGAGDAEHPWGVQYMHDGRCHSYFWYISPDEFFDAHPEYFSEIGGKRIRTETQLCLTNPDVLEIVTERMLARMESKPEMQQHNFSQMDYYNYCECAECTAINRQYGTNGGTQYWFLNKLAERTAQVYPDKLIGTLAYMYTEEPPKDMKMHPNIAVWLCHMYPSCDSHSVRSCPLNADYNTVRNLMYPFSGGEETRIGGLFMAHMGGSMEPAVSKEVNETSVTLEAQTANGFLLERTITLAPDRPALTVTAVATNPRGQTVEAQIRSHFDVDIGDVQQTRVSFTNRAGNQVDMDMTDIIAGFREGERCHEEDRPDGSWTFTGPDGVRVTQKFENADVDFTWLVAYPDYLNQLEVEVWGHKAILEQGQTASLVHEIEIDVP